MGFLKMEKLRCFLMVGIPASGKSSYSRQLASTSNAKIISTDLIREKIYGDANYQGTWKNIEVEIYKLMKKYIKKNISFIVDATNTKKEHRAPLLKFSDSIEWVCYWLDTDLQICKERNLERLRTVPNNVIDNMHYQLIKTPPRLSEGFSRIFKI